MWLDLRVVGRVGGFARGGGLNRHLSVSPEVPQEIANEMQEKSEEKQPQRRAGAIKEEVKSFMFHA